MSIGNYAGKQESKVRINTRAFNNMAKVANTLRNQNFDTKYFITSHDGGGQFVTLNTSSILEDIAWRLLPFAIVADNKDAGTYSSDDSFRNILVRGGYVKFTGVNRKYLKIRAWEYDTEGKADFAKVDYDETLTNEDEYKLLGINPLKDEELITQDYFRLPIENGHTEWIWLELGVGSWNEEGELIEFAVDAGTPNCLRINHGPARPVIVRAEGDPDTLPDEYNHSGESNKENSILVLGMVKNLGGTLWIYQEALGNQVWYAPISFDKYSFGFRINEDQTITIYDGYVILGEDNYHSNETTIEPSGNPIFVFVKMDKLGSTPTIDWANEKSSNTMSNYFIDLYEFNNTSQGLSLKKIRSGLKDVVLDGPIR
jgi:hypothetical protein